MSDPSNNPYESPQEAVAWDDLPSLPHDPVPQVAQVRYVAITSIAVGVLECLVSLFGFFVAAAFPLAYWLDADGRFAQPFGTGSGMWFIVGIYLVMGIVQGIAGGLHVVAGYRNYSFRGRRLGLAAMGIGLITVVTGCCAPTAIGVAAYGMIIYLNEGVVQAFLAGEAGYKPQQILAAFGPEKPKTE